MHQESFPLTDGLGSLCVFLAGSRWVAIRRMPCIRHGLSTGCRTTRPSPHVATPHPVHSPSMTTSTEPRPPGRPRPPITRTTRSPTTPTRTTCRAARPTRPCITYTTSTRTRASTTAAPTSWASRPPVRTC